MVLWVVIYSQTKTASYKNSQWYKHVIGKKVNKNASVQLKNIGRYHEKLKDCITPMLNYF